MNVVILDEAAEDIEAARLFYRSRDIELGEYFLDCILADVIALETLAGIHTVQFGFYRMLSRRFPFGLYYEIGSDTAYIYAILDLRKNPLWIRSELEKRGSS